MTVLTKATLNAVFNYCHMSYEWGDTPARLITAIMEAVPEWIKPFYQAASPNDETYDVLCTMRSRKIEEDELVTDYDSLRYLEEI